MSSQDPSAALISLLAILSQTNPPTLSNPSHPLPPPPQQTYFNPSIPSTISHEHVDYTNVEPVFPEGDILDTTPWIGIPTTEWHSPKKWSISSPLTPQHPSLNSPRQFQQSHHPHGSPSSSLNHSSSSLVSRPETLHRPNSPPPKQKCSPSKSPTPSRIPQTTSAIDPPSYAHALKYIIQRTQDPEFIQRLRNLRSRQDDFETDLWDQRESIKRKFQGKRTMDKVLENLGSGFLGEKVPSPRLSPCSLDP